MYTTAPVREIFILEPVNSRKENDRFPCSICLLPKPPPTGLSLYSRFRERELSFSRDLDIWDSYYQWWFYNVVESDLENAWFSRTGVSISKTILTYKIAKIDCFEGHVWPDCENMSYATTLRIKSLTKDNFGQLRFSREDISVTEDFGRRPQRPTCYNIFALRRNQQTHLQYLLD